MVGKAQREGEVAGHIPPGVREQRERDAGAQLFMQSKAPAHGTMLPMFREGLITSVNLMQKPSHRHARDWFSW